MIYWEQRGKLLDDVMSGFMRQMPLAILLKLYICAVSTVYRSPYGKSMQCSHEIPHGQYSRIHSLYAGQYYLVFVYILLPFQHYQI